MNLKAEKCKRNKTFNIVNEVGFVIKSGLSKSKAAAFIAYKNKQVAKAETNFDKTFAEYF